MGSAEGIGRVFELSQVLSEIAILALRCDSRALPSQTKGDATSIFLAVFMVCGGSVLGKPANTDCSDRV